MTQGEKINHRSPGKRIERGQRDAHTNGIMDRYGLKYAKTDSAPFMVQALYSASLRACGHLSFTESTGSSATFH